MFETTKTYTFSSEQKKSFKSGELIKEWYDKYPMLFDDKDYKIAVNQATLGYHYFEWLAAINLYRDYEYLSLVEQYEFKSHQRKQGILKQILTEESFQLLFNRPDKFKDTQCPDLFVYSQDYTEYFLCEVKGDKDKIRANQQEFFTYIEDVVSIPVKTLKFIR